MLQPRTVLVYHCRNEWQSDAQPRRKKAFVVSQVIQISCGIVVADSGFNLLDNVLCAVPPSRYASFDDIVSLVILFPLVATSSRRIVVEVERWPDRRFHQLSAVTSLMSFYCAPLEKAHIP